MCVSMASLYCNMATRDAFALLFRKFFETARLVTGKPLQFVAFKPEGEPNPQLHCILFDAEAAQMQGFGDVLSGIMTKDPSILVQHVSKTCLQHFIRNIDKLPGDVPRDVINCLKSFPGLSCQEEIDEWNDACKNSPHKSVRDWHKQKMSYPWYLPSLNSFLLPMYHTSWRLTPNDTNIAETAHAARNAKTGIKLPLLAAIQDTRVRDKAVAAKLDECDAKSGCHANRFNTALAREGRSGARCAASNAKAMAVNKDRRNLKGYEDKHADLDAKEPINTRIVDINNELNLMPNKNSTAADHLHEEWSQLKCQLQDGVSQRKIWSARSAELQTLIKNLKTTELKGVRSRDSRTPSLTPRHVRSQLPSLPHTPSRNSGSPYNTTPLRNSLHADQLEPDLDEDRDIIPTPNFSPVATASAPSPSQHIPSDFDFDSLDLSLLEDPQFVNNLHMSLEPEISWERFF
ncbi:hypothetical protein DXG01_002897 [Tephrocybe rancida]|nr:hypothetical protein DXG01_002897 [Tephrocybe rancida]